MDISTSAVQSYQKNQNLADWVQQTEQLSKPDTSDPELPTISVDHVSISGDKEIYNWMAQSFPSQNQNAETIGRMGQALHAYQLLNIHDLKELNRVVADVDERPILKSLNDHIDAATSFELRRQLSHLRQVFSTIEAARVRPA